MHKLSEYVYHLSLFCEAIESFALKWQDFSGFCVAMGSYFSPFARNGMFLVKRSAFDSFA